MSEPDARTSTWPPQAGIWVQTMGGRSMTFGFEVVAHPLWEHDGGLAADGMFVTAHVPVGADASAPRPERFRAVIKAAA